jgi:hypothetical protein
MFLITASLFFVQPAQAGYIVTLHQVGPNVVATGSGAIDFTGLTFGATDVFDSQIIPFLGSIITGAIATVDLFDGAITGPTSFGSGLQTFASSGTGDIVGISGTGVLTLPDNYVSGSALSNSATWNNATVASLGVTRLGWLAAQIGLLSPIP